MTVHTSGKLAPTASDLQTMHYGVQIMLKCIDWGSGLPGIYLSEKKGDVWENFAVLYEFGDTDTPEMQTKAAAGTVAWIKTVLLPLINSALAARFPATGATQQPSTDAGTLADIDAQLGAVLAWQPQLDGTLRMVAK